MDESFQYASKFSLRILVIPVVPIKTAVYASHLSQLRRQHSRIALADVPPPSIASGQSLSSLLHPTHLSKGFLLLDFISPDDLARARLDAQLGWLHEFEVHRRITAVLGILDCTEWADEAEGLKEGAEAFQEQAEALDLRMDQLFARRCFAFKPTEGQKDTSNGLVVIPSVGDLAFYTNTLMAEMCSSILVGLSNTVNLPLCRYIDLIDLGADA